MQITVAQFQQLVYTAHRAQKKHKNLFTAPFKQTCNDIVTFAQANINWESYVNKFQAETVYTLLYIYKSGYVPD